jgi:hypothetical protein
MVQHIAAAAVDAAARDAKGVERSLGHAQRACHGPTHSRLGGILLGREVNLDLLHLQSLPILSLPTNHPTVSNKLFGNRLNIFLVTFRDTKILKKCQTAAFYFAQSPYHRPTIALSTPTTVGDDRVKIGLLTIFYLTCYPFRLILYGDNIISTANLTNLTNGYAGQLLANCTNAACFARQLPQAIFA